MYFQKSLFGTLLFSLLSFGSLAQSDTSLYINSSGLVGIGTTNPDFLLHLKSATANNQTIFSAGQPNTDVARIITDDKGAGTFGLWNESGTQTAKLHSSGDSYLTGGNLGIGVSTPQSSFHIQSSTTPNTMALIRNSNDAAKIQLQMDFASGSTSDTNNGAWIAFGGSQIQNLVGGPNALQFWNSEDGPSVFATNNAERMRILNTGQIGIGVTSPGATLEVDAQSGAPGLIVSGSGTSSGSNAIQTARFLNNGYGSAATGVTSSDWGSIKFINNSSNSSYITGIISIVASSSDHGFGTNGNYSTTSGYSLLTHRLTEDKHIVLTSPLVRKAEIQFSGNGTLENGESRVDFDSDLRSLLADGDYRVLLTPTAMCNGLAVLEKSDTGFEVKELSNGTSSGSFDWFIVGVRSNTHDDQSEAPLPEKLPIDKSQE